MDIVFSNRKFEKECNNQRLLEKNHGTDRAKRIRRRLDNLRDANVLEDMRNLPGRCHELLQDRAGQLSLDLDHPYRLIFEPADEPIPTKPDGGIDWNKVTVVRILGVEDTHE
ncbi:MAG: killer suppression protein [Pelatocladus maniniholoensis HA4357-MV3]|jgi:plasmid maintenance system killer protein|uniref:Killer suppression protein n=1 Tax=Pelatocladus maniniholoensis HA4357-MV3 TaxID=1117104 RepID=A0A9E3H8N8_9NOST|nr:killer suppression protein [Pelatocladus maniniholoensis HA4357-MV3]BAZ69203.1 putative killer suppression protein HigA [Fischerella sp. NIES-4106]